MKDKFMKAALKEAQKAQNKDEVPVGCVIVKDNKIIARGHNLKEKNCNAILHAEIVTLQKAYTKLKAWRCRPGKSRPLKPIHQTLSLPYSASG